MKNSKILNMRLIIYKIVAIGLYVNFSLSLLAQAEFDYVKLPDEFSKHCSQDFMSSVYSGETSFDDLSFKKNKKWTVYSDRENNILYTSSNSRTRTNKKLSFMQALYVADYDGDGNWLKVVDKETENQLGWIQSKYLILSKYSLNSSINENNPVSLNIKKLIIPNLDALESNNQYTLEEIEQNKKFFKVPSANNSYLAGTPRDFEVFYVFKVKRDNNGTFVLLSTNNMIGNNIITNRSIVKGWMPDLNTTSWDTRLMLENTEDLDMKDVYQGKTLLGFKELSSVNDFINGVYNSDSAVVQFEVDCMPNDVMRRPVIKYLRKDENSRNDNIVRVVSISKEVNDNSGIDPEIIRRMLADLTKKSQNINIIFCVDATSSMRPYKQAISSSVTEIMKENERIFSNNLDFSVILYRDHADGERAMEYHELTSDQAKIKEFINNINFSSKNPLLPESQFNGIISGLDKINPNPDESNIMVLIGDCGNHEDDKYGLTAEDVGDKLFEYGVNLISFQVARKYDDTYDEFGYGIDDFVTTRCKKIIGNRDDDFRVKWGESTYENSYELAIESIASNYSEKDYSNAFGSSTRAVAGQPMEAEVLERNIVTRIREYQKLVGENINVLRGDLYDPKVGDVAPGVILHIMNKTGCTESEAREFLTRQAVTMSAYVAVDYGQGRTQDYVVYMTGDDYNSLKRSLKKFNKSINDANTSTLFSEFQDLLIELVEKIIGSSTHKDFGKYDNSHEVAENMTLNEAWLQIFGVEYSHPDFEEIRDEKLGEIASFKKKNLLKKVIDEFSANSETFIYSNYTSNCDNCCDNRFWEFNGKEIFWVPLSDLPGTGSN